MVLPWRAEMLGSCFPGVSRPAFPILAKKASRSEPSGAETPLLTVSVTRWIRTFASQNEIFSWLWRAYTWLKVVWNLAWILLYHSVTVGFYLTHAFSSKPFRLSFRTRGVPQIVTLHKTKFSMKKHVSRRENFWERDIWLFVQASGSFNRPRLTPSQGCAQPNI